MSTAPSASTTNLTIQQQDTQFWDQSQPFPPKSNPILPNKSSPAQIFLPIQENSLGENELEMAQKSQFAINYLLQELQDNDPGLSFIVSRQQATNLKKQLTELAKQTSQGFDTLNEQLLNPSAVNFDQIQNLTKASCGQIQQQILAVSERILEFTQHIQGVASSVEFEELKKLSGSVEEAKNSFEKVVAVESELSRLEGAYKQLKEGNIFFEGILSENEEKLNEIKGHCDILKKRNEKLNLNQNASTLRERYNKLITSNFDFGMEIGYNMAIQDFLKALNENPAHQDEFWGDVVDKSESGKGEAIEIPSENYDEK